MRPILRVTLIVIFLIGCTNVFAQNKNVNSTTENHAPVFVKEMPDTTVDTGKKLQFKYVATDADGDKLRYSYLGSLPSGATISDSTGLFSWLPAKHNAGRHEITLIVSDGKETTRSRISKITVYIPLTYDCTITLLSNPAEAGKYAWSQQFHFIGDTATVQASPNRGFRFLNWTENEAVVSTDSNYTFIVNGDRKLVANFRINHAPVFVKQLPDTTILSGKTLIYQYKAEDPDGDIIKYRFKSSKPINALLDSVNGFFVWRPTNTQGGKHTIQIIASDGNLSTTSRQTVITVIVNVDVWGEIEYICNPMNGGKIYNSFLNDTITIRAVPNDGYRFQNWSFNGVVVSTDSVFKFKTPDIPKTAVAANFRINHAPVFVKEMPDTTIGCGYNYFYNYKAVDPDGDSIKYYLQFALPQNCILLSNGTLIWRPANSQLGIYQVSILATDGNLTVVSKVARVIVISIGDVSEKETFPSIYFLSQNYPNPFNPETTISYSVPNGSHVILKVFDILGREVARLVDEYKQAGNYNSQFFILNFQLSSGVYFYQLKAGSFVETKKLVVCK